MLSRELALPPFKMVDDVVNRDQQRTNIEHSALISGIHGRLPFAHE